MNTIDTVSVDEISALPLSILSKDRNVQPSLFLPHGAPDLPVSGHEAGNFIRQLGHSLSKPDGIVIISAHWESRGIKFTSNRTLDTIYDFYGFGDEIRQIVYPARTEQNLLEKLSATLSEAGYEFSTDAQRGLDHGAWIPLHLLYPEADIPVVQISLDMTLSPEELYRFGQALTSLRDDNILIIGSGGTVHNLGRISRNGNITPQWARDFDQWLDRILIAGDTKSLFEFGANGPSASLAHPTTEHLLPLLVAAGAGGDAIDAHKLHSSFSYGSIGMSAWAFV